MNQQYCETLACFADKHSDGLATVAVLALVALIIVAFFYFNKDNE